MLSKFVLLAIVTLASVSQGQACMQSAAMSLGGCFEPLRAYSMGNVPVERISSFCRDGSTAVSCMHRLFDDCPQLRVAMSGNVEVIENNINQACLGAQTEAPQTDAPETEGPQTYAPETEAPETDAPATDLNIVSQCSPKDVRKMQRCANRLQKFMGRSNIKCGKVRKTMDCLETTTQRCSDMMGPAEMPLDTIRQQLLQNCVETNQLPEEYTGGPQIGEVVEEGEDGEEEGEEEVEVCPADFASRMQRCVEDMNSVLTRFRSGAADLAEACSALTSAVDCVGDYMEACSDRPEVEQLSRMLNMEQTRRHIAQICTAGGTDAGPDGGSEAGTGPGEGDSECPADFEGRIQACVAPMQAMNPQVMDDEVCSAANDALDCLDDVVNACRNNPDVQAFTTIMNLDSARQMINDLCESGTLPPGPGVDADCPSDHSAKLLECVEPLQNIQQTPNMNVQEMCRVANTGFDCLDDIMGKCANQPDVNAMSNMLNFDHVRGMLREQCVAKTGGGDDTCHVADPAEALLKCNRELQNAASSGASLRLKCRVMFESLDCFDRLITNCPSDPSIVAFTDMLDINEVRTTLSGSCPSRR
ncbi:uncharacterized protein LOC124287173 [Haliotis rubra]|uniref:uncharacterized protein LOC124287173 n=1 Tax=Haliotis rubra TaxID=36100 RepID=UPI001EE5B593|nr:uncharacterized protein LOC124287173 [Haliotis rubra]